MEYFNLQIFGWSLSFLKFFLKNLEIPICYKLVKTRMTISGTIVFIVLSTWLVHRFTNSRADQSQNTLSYWSLYFVSVWTSQGPDIHKNQLVKYTNNAEDSTFVFKGITIRNPSTPFRMVIIVSVLGLYIIAMFFTAAYTSYLTTPIFRKTLVNSIEDLANSKKVATLLIKGSSTDEYIMVRPTYLPLVVTNLSFPPYRSQPAKSVVRYP